MMIAGSDYKACVSCGPYQTSPPESPSQDYCECRAGYGTEDDVDKCELCPLGTFWGGPKSPSQHLTALKAKPARRVSPCISCSDAFPEGFFTTAARGSTSQSQCVCLPGKDYGPLTVRTRCSSSEMETCICIRRRVHWVLQNSRLDG